LHNPSEKESSGSAATTRKLTQGIVNLSANLEQTDAEAEASRFLWGAEGGVKPMANNIIDAHSGKSSAKEKRKERQEEAEKTRQLLSDAIDQEPEEGEGGLVRMNFKTFDRSDATDRKKDVALRDVMVSLNNGTVLLESGELKLTYQRRYGLIGENGVGKSTLLKEIAREDGIPGFPNHLRVLHVRQEVPMHLTEEITVLEAVLQADVERNSLMETEKELLAKLEKVPGAEDSAMLTVEEKRLKFANQGETMKEFEADLKQLNDIYARLQLLGADSAEARVAMILSGLQFTLKMQHVRIWLRLYRFLLPYCLSSRAYLYSSLSLYFRRRFQRYRVAGGCVWPSQPPYLLSQTSCCWMVRDMRLCGYVCMPIDMLVKETHVYPSPSLLFRADQSFGLGGRAVAGKLFGGLQAHATCRLSRPRIPQRSMYGYYGIQAQKAHVLQRKF
jgi:ABC-type molybdenum transport system ATPase subunit/photorepair protein PhrA